MRRRRRRRRHVEQAGGRRSRGGRVPYVLMAFVVMAYIVMAYIVMALEPWAMAPGAPGSRGATRRHPTARPCERPSRARRTHTAAIESQRTMEQVSPRPAVLSFGRRHDPQSAVACRQWFGTIGTARRLPPADRSPPGLAVVARSAAMPRRLGCRRGLKATATPLAADWLSTGFQVAALSSVGLSSVGPSSFGLK